MVKTFRFCRICNALKPHCNHLRSTPKPSLQRLTETNPRDCTKTVDRNQPGPVDRNWPGRRLYVVFRAAGYGNDDQNRTRGNPGDTRVISACTKTVDQNQPRAAPKQLTETNPRSCTKTVDQNRNRAKSGPQSAALVSNTAK